uniref:Splicing factor 1 n=1 Tax=Saimiri boliviensis boliviensis TaxID=39432 RepID=A0A2K6SUK2_SAIBB
MATGANATPLDFPRKKRKRSLNPRGLTREQEGAYLVQLQIEDLTRKLRTGDPGIPPNPEDRSPSPEPICSSEGKQLNTREVRTRQKLQEERHNLITEMVALNPDFNPPADYKPPATRVTDKVMIPQDEYPEINFVGLLIGPRGSTLKNIEKECSAQIMIRGKGSVKEGRVGRKDGQMLPGEDEPLHALVTANTMENIKKAMEQIRNIWKQGIQTPEDQNNLRKMQLQELACLNGTLQEDDNRILRPWQISETCSITNTTVCTKCGGAGHIASDCRFQRPEYLSLMAELGEAPVPLSMSSTSGPAITPLASTLHPAAPTNNPPPPSLMSTTQNRPPWMNSGPSESRPYHGMHGGGPGGPGGGPCSFPHRLPSLTGGHGGHPMQHNPNGPPPPWMQPPPLPMNQGPHPPGHHVHGKYACGLWGVSPASRKRYDATAWAAPAPSLWSSSSTATVAAAAAAASATPSAQQQYGFQCPLSMAAKYHDYHHKRWHRVHPTMATATGGCHSFSRSPSDARQPQHGAPAPQGPAASAA